MLYVWVALQLATGATESPAEQHERSIAVLDVTPATEQDVALAKNATPLLVKAVADVTKAKVVGVSEVKAMLDAQAAQALLGCEDDRCFADLSKSLAVDEIVVARAGTVGKSVLLSLSLVAAKDARVTARASTTAPSSSPLPALARGAAITLVDPEAAKAGDEPLSALRLAVLVDELGVDGQPLALKAVETCVADGLDQLGAAVVAADQVQTLRAVLSPRDVVTGAIPAALSSRDVDAALVGVVAYAEGGKVANAIGMRGDMTLRLVRVDSAQVLASRQLDAAGVGFQPVAAQRDAGKKLCSAALPALKDAMAQRSARGSRIVVEVGKLKGAADALRIKQLLSALPRVTQVQVRRAGDKDATIDVTLAGADAVALALQLDAAETSGVAVREAEAGRVRLDVR